MERLTVNKRLLEENDTFAIHDEKQSVIYIFTDEYYI